MVATRSHRKVGNMEMMFFPMLEALFRILLGTPVYIYINLYIILYHLDHLVSREYVDLPFEIKRGRL